MTDCRDKLYSVTWKQQSGKLEDQGAVGVFWEEAQQRAVNRNEWRRNVALCVFDTG